MASGKLSGSSRFLLGLYIILAVALIYSLWDQHQRSSTDSFVRSALLSGLVIGLAAYQFITEYRQGRR